jgi:hypothetical protein
MYMPLLLSVSTASHDAQHPVSPATEAPIVPGQASQLMDQWGGQLCINCHLWVLGKINKGKFILRYRMWEIEACELGKSSDV